MPRKLKDTKQEAFERGQRVEEAAQNLAQRLHNKKCGRATRWQDKYEHWDFGMRPAKGGPREYVEVKGAKSVFRHPWVRQDEWTWLEYRGVSSSESFVNGGWLYGGKADYVAFERRYDFLIARRTDLITLLERMVPRTGSPYIKHEKEPAFYKLKSRPDRHDIVSLVETRLIEQIACDVWPKQKPGYIN